MGRIVHQQQQLSRLVDDGGAVAPGEDGGKESCNLDILLLTKPVRDRNRVVRYKLRPIESCYLLIKGRFDI